MDTTEREIIADLVNAVRTLASQVLTVHLQVGALRALLVSKGAISEVELTGILTHLQATTAAETLLDDTAPDADEIFRDLLSRLGAD